MAYIDFYRKGIQYRVILGRMEITNAKINAYGTYYGRIDGQYNTTLEIGSELSSLFNIKNLNFNNADTTVNGKPCFVFSTSDEKLHILIFKSNYYDFSTTGRVGTSDISYNYTCERYELWLTTSINAINQSTGRIDVGEIQIPTDGIYTSHKPTNNIGLQAFSNIHTSLYLACYKTVYDGKDLYAYSLYNCNANKASKFIFGMSDALEGGLVRGYSEGVAYEKTNPIIRVKRPQGFEMYYTQEDGWNNTKDYSKFILYGKGTKVQTLFQSLDTWWYPYFYRTETNDTKPTDPNFPKYPSDDDDKDDDDTPTGGDGDHDKTSDDVTDEEVNPSYSITGLITIYELGESNLQSLGKELWSDNVFQKFLKITANPIDAIIGLYVSYINFNAETAQNIMLGNVELDILANVVNKPIHDVDLGELKINEFWGDFKDYNPYTKIQLYLPYIGTVDLNVNEIMNSKIKLKYRFNILSNTCVALITVTKTVDGTELNSVLYQYDGSFLDEIPISMASNNTKISARLAQLGALNTGVRQIGNTYINQGTSGQGILNMATSGVNAGVNMLQHQIDANHLDISRTGNLKGSAGILSIYEPYLIIERCMPSYPSSFAKNLGVPLNTTLKLSTLKGFTQIQEIFISNFTGTDNEYSELISLLQQGVVF